MDHSIMLLCKFGLSSAAIKASSNLRLCGLVKQICQKWRNLLPASVSLFYCIVGHPKCMIDDEIDLENMFETCVRKGVDCVDIIVHDRNIDNDTDDDSMNNCIDDMVLDVPVLCDGRVDENDMLPSFCKHNEKLLLSAAWAQGLSHVGQVFEGGVTELRNVLCKFAVERGFQFKYVKNDKVRLTVVCAMKDVSGCRWQMHARANNTNGFFYVKQFNNIHTCGATVRTFSNSRISSDLVANEIGARVRDKPLTRPSDVQYDFKVDYGLNISYQLAWLAVEKAKAELFGDYNLSFDQLRWYVDVARNTNPGSYIVVDHDHDSRRFKRMFVAFNACIIGFNHCRPMLFLDGTFLKGRFKGHLLAATAKDGNQGLFPVCFAVVDSENEDNWGWFLTCLTEIVDQNRTVTFISDRNKGLLESVPKIFPNSHHGFCLQHLKANLRDKLAGGRQDGFRDRMISRLNKCAYAPTETSFMESLNKLISEGKERVKQFLSDAPYDHWSNAYFKGKRYGEMYSNAAESFNSWIREARHLPITRMVDKIRTQIMRQMGQRNSGASTWNGVLCPNMETRLQNALKAGRSWVVSASSTNVYEVHSFPSVSVDIENRTCSCFQWQLNGFPCAHAATAIEKSGKDIYSFVEYFFRVECYRASYNTPIYPIPTVGKPNTTQADAVILPPLCKRQPGRPKKKRILSRGETIREVRCGRCGRLGHHNRKSCKEPISAA